MNVFSKTSITSLKGEMFYAKKRFLSAKEVGEIMGRSTSYAHRYICQLNEELEKKGYLTIKGRVVSTYFYERFFDKDDETKDNMYVRIQR